MFSRFLIIILLINCQSLFADYNPKDIVNFIKDSGKVYIQLAKRQINRPDNVNKFSLFFATEKQHIGNFLKRENDEANYYLVIDLENDDVKIGMKAALKSRTNSEKEFISFEDNKIFYLEEFWTLPHTKKVKKNKDFRNELIFLDGNRLIQLHYTKKDHEESENIKNWHYYTKYCSFIDELHSNYKNISNCNETQEIDPNDFTQANKDIPTIYESLYEYKILSVYDVKRKTYFDIDNEKGETVDLENISNKKPRLPVFEKEEIKPELPESLFEIYNKDYQKEEPKIISENLTISSGSGFFITELGHVITNNHVISDCKIIRVNNYKANIIDFNQINDIALLKIEESNNSYLKIRKTEPKPGEDIIVLGYPFGKLSSSDSSVTKGIINSLSGFGNDKNKIQIDAAIQSGNSGGPTLGMDGAVVGVTVAKANIKFFIENFNDLPQNMNFSVKSSSILQITKRNNVKADISNTDKIYSSADLYEKSKDAVVYIECLK